VNIPSPAGVLQADLQRPPALDGAAESGIAQAPTGTVAVLCHPHPLYGGNMHDAVLDCLASALLAAGVTCLRFNFRGVGASSGRHDGGAGEVDDLLAAIAWLVASEQPQHLWLGGYSFGSHVVWESLGRGSAPDRLLLVAPPVGRMPFASRHLDCPADVFAGDADEFADQALLATWAGINLHLIKGADHFFVGYRDILQRRIEQAIS
jgi:alpha/beta superfamily hydrolase